MKELLKEELKKIMEDIFKDTEINLNLLKYNMTHGEFAERLNKFILAKKQIRKLIEEKPRVTKEFVEKLINAVIDPLDDFDLPEEQRLYMQVTDETRDEVKQLLIEAGMEVEK